MADKKELNTVDSNTGKLSNGLVVEYTGEDEAIKNSDWNKAAQKASKVLAAEAANPRPKFALEDGKVTVYGSDETLAHPAVAQMKKAISDAFKGKDLTDKDVATAFQKAIKEANNQIEAQLNYEEYEDFLKRAGFSDAAYRTYATARQEFKKPDVVNSTATVTTYDKNGKLVTKSIKEWFDYWKSEYNPEDRGQMWIKSLQAAYNPTTDEDLYKAIPALLMGSKKTQNIVQGFFQWINPFDDKGAEAPAVVPINGFDDTDHFSAGVQSAIATFGRILPDIGEAFTNPWENLGATSGEGRYNFKERFGSEYSDADLPFVENEDDFNWLVEMGKKYSDQEMREMFGNDRIARQAAIANDPAFGGDYQKFKEFSESVTGDNAWNAAKSWDQNLQEAIERFSTYAPNAASTGVIAGTIARIAAEQMALSLVSGGALSASNIAKTLSRTGWKGVGNLTGAIRTGQEVAAKSSAFAKAINALAGTSAAGLSGASRIIYRLGKIGEFALREVGEDALRGLVDDIVTGNSFDSQGNLDPDKFIENVYMNAVVAAFKRAGGSIKGGVRVLLDAEKNIDGVKLPSESKAQLNELIEASSDTADSVVKAIDEDGHPIITRGGQDRKLDQITLTKDNAGKISPETAPTKTIAEAAADDAEVREAIKDIADSTNAKGAETVDGDLPGSKMTVEGADAKSVKDQLERKLNDDALRRKFTNGKVSINGEDYILDVKDANLSDLASANGSTVKNFADGVGKLVDSVKQGLRSYQEAVNGVLAHMDEFASNWAKAVNDFAAEHNVTARDVIIGLRDLRIDGNETIPGLKQLWEDNWKPMADKLLDAQDSLTKIRTNRQDYYQRDMLANTINIDNKGNVEINQGTIDNILGTDKQFDLTASSRKGNRQKISDDQLETNPEILAKEFVLSRLETIKKYSKQGQVIATMREALDDGEELTQKEAAEALAASKKVGNDIRGSREVKNVTEQTTSMDNVEELADGFGKEDMTKLNEDIEKAKKQLADDQRELKALKGAGSQSKVDEIKQQLKDRYAQLREKGLYDKRDKDASVQWLKQELDIEQRKLKNTSDTVDGHDYITKKVSDGYEKFANDNLSDRRAEMDPVDRAANIAIEQRIVTPGGLADELNPGLRKGKKINPEAVVDGLNVRTLADNYYLGNARDVAEWSTWDDSNLFKLSNDLLGTKFEDGVDYGYEAAKEAENAIKGKLKDAIPRALENFGNKKLDNDVVLYRVISEGNEVNKGNIDFLKKDSGEFKNSGISYLTLDENAVLDHPNLTGSGKKYILRVKMPKGDSISAFDRSVLTQNYGDFGDEALASSGHRAGGEFAANLDGYKFEHTGEFNKDGIEILNVYKDTPEAKSKDVIAAEEKVAEDQKALNDLEARKQLAEKLPKQSDKPKTEAQQEADNKKTIDAIADTAKGEAEKAQKEFDAAANKSNAAEEISKSSKYKNRAKAQANQNPIGVNYMPGNPFRGFAKWMNDNFVKSQSVQISDGKKVYSAYSGGYSLYAEAGSWARQVIINIRNGQDLTTALYNVISQNGIKIEPSDYAKKKYQAKTAAQKDMEKVSAIIDRITSNALYSKAVKDGKVVNTELLGAMITKSLRRQGAIEFMRFLKKADFTTFTKDQQKWLNSQAYKITASMDPNTYSAIKKAISKAMNAVMAAKYRSNMYMNLKNAQLQLTEIQRLFTLNKLGDFTKTVRRLITDAEFRDKVSDAAYVYADDSIGAGMSKQDLSVYRQSLESYLKTADASTVTGKGVITALNNKIQDGAKAAIDGVDNDMLGGIEAAEYFKNYMLLAGIIQSAESRGYTGATADAYIRNRFNTEALAGTEIGHIGLVDSSIGRLGFMYLGFPLRELTLQAHILKGGGTFGGTTKYDKFMGGAAYAGKMLGAKGLVWALEAPWGYKFADVLGYDPFGVINNRDETSDNRNVDPWMRTLDIAMQYNPFFQGAVTSSMVDVYMAYRESYEDAKDEWLETHDDLSGFEWNLDDAPQDAIWTDFASGYIPGYTAFSRAMGEASDLDSGYGKASSGRLTYEANQDPGSIAWGFLAGRSNTPNAREYYQTADPINDISRYGLAGLGRSIERALPFRLNRQEGAQIGWRNFREFDPIDSTTYKDWFDGSFADEQNWLTGYYAFREEAEEIRDAANQDANQNNALEKLATRESQLTDLRGRVERYVQAYLDNHPEGISNYKMQQIQRIFNMELPEAGTTLDRALGDYSDYEKTYAANRIAQGNFPNPVGMNTPYKTDTGEIAGDYSFAESAKLQDILKTQQYGVQSDVGRVIKQLDDQLVATPYGSMSFKDFRKKTQDAINQEYAKSKVDYDKVADLQSKYLDVFDQVIRPIFATYGSNILSAGQSSDVMQQFTSMLNGLIPSDEYRVDKKGRSIRQSTPYMRVDIKKWLQKNYGNYPAVSTTDNSAEDRLRGIREDMDAGRIAVARAKVLAFIEDIREGRASVDRGRLEELQNILRGSLDANVITGGGNLNSRINQ